MSKIIMKIIGWEMIRMQKVRIVWLMEIILTKIQSVTTEHSVPEITLHWSVLKGEIINKAEKIINDLNQEIDQFLHLETVKTHLSLKNLVLKRIITVKIHLLRRKRRCMIPYLIPGWIVKIDPQLWEVK